MTVTLYHNPRCSKSRATLELLQQHGVDVELIHYLDTPPTAAELHTLLAALGMQAIELVRRKESVWTALNLNADDDDSQIINAMAQHPILIERPIAVVGNKAVIGRPPENVLTLIR